jgi:hypothetical protein
MRLDYVFMLALNTVKAVEKDVRDSNPSLKYIALSDTVTNIDSTWSKNS